MSVSNHLGEMPPVLDHNQPCCCPGCDKPAMFVPAICVWAKGYPKTTVPIKAEVGMQFCRVHRSDFSISDIGPALGELLEGITKAMGRAEPDLEGAELEWIPIVSEV
jgi:hypothetical protein